MSRMNAVIVKGSIDVCPGEKDMNCPISKLVQSDIPVHVTNNHNKII